MLLPESFIFDVSFLMIVRPFRWFSISIVGIDLCFYQNPREHPLPPHPSRIKIHIANSHPLHPPLVTPPTPFPIPFSTPNVSPTPPFLPLTLFPSSLLHLSPSSAPSPHFLHTASLSSNKMIGQMKRWKRETVTFMNVCGGSGVGIDGSG